MKDGQNSSKKTQIHLLHLFSLEFSFSSLQQRSSTLFRRSERPGFGVLKFTNVSFKKPGTQHLIKQSSGKKDFSNITGQTCIVISSADQGKQKQMETLPLLAYLFSFRFGTVYIRVCRHKVSLHFDLLFKKITVIVNIAFSVPLWTF